MQLLTRWVWLTQQLSRRLAELAYLVLQALLGKGLVEEQDEGGGEALTFLRAGSSIASRFMEPGYVK